VTGKIWNSVGGSNLRYYSKFSWRYGRKLRNLSVWFVCVPLEIRAGYLQPTFLPQCQRPIFTPIQNNRHENIAGECKEREVEEETDYEKEKEKK
jgi:hypothetical protein